jgi:hypothetical protein
MRKSLSPRQWAGIALIAFAWSVIGGVEAYRFAILHRSDAIWPVSVWGLFLVATLLRLHKLKAKQ